MIFVSNKFSVFFIIHNNLVDWSSEMFGHVPIVDGSVGITRAKNWGITVSISDINLAIVNLVLVKGVFWLHHSVRVQMCTIEENSSTSKSVCVDLSCLLTTKSGIKRTFERPWAVSLFLENKWHVVEATANVSILTDEVSGHDWIAVVDNAFWLRLGLSSDHLFGEIWEVHLTIVRSVSQSCTTWTPRQSVVPNISLQSEHDSTHFFLHACEWAWCARVTFIEVWIVRARDNDGTIARCGGDDTTGAWIETNSCHWCLVQWLAKRRFLSLWLGNPKVELYIVRSHKDMAWRATHAEFVASSVPWCIVVWFEFLHGT